ncbi:MFS-type transporter SLC18B1-like [Actinia tenebrosa]|uniref:MFS-type transporter SLC18B1-like n=1 Tax=Actinia tenebrosa TaxID=6105 RepID=A0A6P8IX16_ACTTE|nr:MFS-type transporter SLC18B1-like [Actinia tenebrosa]
MEGNSAHASSYSTIQPTAAAEDASLTQLSPPTSPWAARKVLVFCLLSFVYFLTWCYVGLLAPFFPEEANKFGINESETGLIFGVYSLVAFLASFIYGSFLLPKIGPYFVLFFGLFLNGGAVLIFGYLNLLPKGQMFAVFCLVTRGISALGGSACETAVMVILIQEFRDNLTTVIGMLELFTGLGFTLGPFAGGALYSLGGFRLPLLVTGGLLLSALPMVWLFLPRTDFIESENKKGKRVWKEALGIPGVIVLCVAMFVGIISISFLDPTLQPHAEKFGLNSTGVGLVFLVYSVTYMASTPIVGRILEKQNWKRFFLVIGFFVSSVCTLFFGPAPFLPSFIPRRKVWVLMLSVGIAGAANALYYVPIMPELLACCYERGMKKDVYTDSMASGLFTAFSNLGGFVGAFVGGILVDHLRFEWTSTIIAGLVFLMSIALAIFFSCFRRKKSVQRRSSDPERKRLIDDKNKNGHDVNKSQHIVSI